ncbi:MAG: Rne/Rng family ribonuclease [Planctomycetota bacterium]|nr:MAG: Rne/Rng family ribonuclease [Planctomycetota bacterium]
MTKRMLINVAEAEESRVAVVEDDVLSELYVERASEEKYLGNIYKGRVANIEPSIQAAFVDFGQDINGFLHVSDIMPAYGKDAKDRQDITQVLSKGQEVLVQITKDQIRTKVPTLTTYISLPGRYLVLMPSISKCGVSKKITSEEERQKLRRLLKELDPPAGMGYIVRTAGVDRTKEELSRDLDYLLNLWKAILKRVKTQESPATIYKETDLVIRSIRDLFVSDIDEIVVDDYDVYVRAKEFLHGVMPRYEDKVKYYAGPVPLFHKYHVEQQIEGLNAKRVPLPSGGSLVIEQTEALVAIDVNSGKFKGEKNLEETAYRTNLLAAEEIARQVRLRDLGGLIVCDFIDMKEQKHRNAVERHLRAHLRKDRARVRVARMSRFSLVEMTRQRVRESLKRTTYEMCEHCQGTGYVKSVESVALQVLREIKLRMVEHPEAERVQVACVEEVAKYLRTKKQASLDALTERFGQSVELNPSRDLRVDQFALS